MSVTVTHREFGRLPDGGTADLFTLANSRGTEVSISTWGAIVTSVRTTDRTGTVGEITLARNTLGEYRQGHPYYGALVGRVCNRISRGGFTLAGRRYDLASNLFSTPSTHSDGLHLHGGVRGFHEYLWQGETREDPCGGEPAAAVRLTRTSPDGEEGYPGTLEVTHTITLTGDNRLIFEFEADTDALTVVNMTNHCYWNLSGESSILDHELMLNVEARVEVDRRAVPTGRFLPVAGTAFDFSRWRPIRPGFEQLQAEGMHGFDHSLAITGALDPPPVPATPSAEPLHRYVAPAAGTLREAARLRAPATGRMMTVATTYPDVHFYSGNNLHGETGRAGETLRGGEALCLECQHFPDAPNRPEFPSIELEPGTHYHHVTEHRFDTD